MSFKFIFSCRILFLVSFSFSLLLCLSLLCGIRVFNDCLEGKIILTWQIKIKAKNIINCISIESQREKKAMASVVYVEECLLIIKYKNEFFKEKAFIADDNKVSSLFSFYVVLCNLIASFHILCFSLNYSIPCAIN